MELTENINSLNSQLIDLFGIDTVTGHPIWRIVWSDDQLEKRLVNTLDSGLFLVTPIVKEVPKYKPWINQKYILERLVIVPEIQQNELPVNVLSYEPVWTFMDADGNYLPPTIGAAKFIIDTIYAAQGKSSLAKYKEEGIDNPIEAKQQRVKNIEEELFGNETRAGDALAYGTGIVVPRNYDTKKES
jgi:hypothetical protein